MDKKVTLHDLQAMKERGEPISMLTAYDYSTALLMDQAGVDTILVGDSLGMVVHGLDSTLPVTMDMMILHAQAVRRGANRAFIVADLPFMSYQLSQEEAMRNAGRLIAEAGVDAVKLEGGKHMADTVRAIVEMGVAVQGHIGLTPQSISAFGGFKAQGKSLETARTIIKDAQALQEAGAFSIVLEAIPYKLAALISRSLTIPTIGIGAGAGCDGQVLVSHDMLGLFDKFTPKFVKQYANMAEPIRDAYAAYCDEVKRHMFPVNDEHGFSISDDIWATVQAEFGRGEQAAD